MKNLVVIGGSAGAIDSLCKIIDDLPRDLPVAIAAVIHLGEGNVDISFVFKRRGIWPVTMLQGSRPIQTGTVVLAPPDKHLIVKPGQYILSKSARENRHRPAIDALFRSAARVYRSQVIAVVLSGMLDDGTGGAVAVQTRGGKIIVQDPDTVSFGEMPANVLRHVDVDYTLPLKAIAPAIAKIVSEAPEQKAKPSDEPTPAEEETSTVLLDAPPGGTPAVFVCPECDGPLFELRNGELAEYRCQVGHRFSLETLTEAQSDALERALWIALRRLNDQRAVHKALIQNNTVDPRMKKRFEESLAAANQDIAALRAILERI